MAKNRTPKTTQIILSIFNRNAKLSFDVIELIEETQKIGANLTLKQIQRALIHLREGDYIIRHKHPHYHYRAIYSLSDRIYRKVSRFHKFDDDS
jgi:hypothetical protein